jgi:hypothetical protein
MLIGNYAIRAVCKYARGWMPSRNFAGLQLEGEIFLLTFPPKEHLRALLVQRGSVL